MIPREFEEAESSIVCIVFDKNPTLGKWFTEYLNCGNFTLLSVSFTADSILTRPLIALARHIHSQP